MSIKAFAIAASSWMSAESFNAKEGRLFPDERQCMEQYQDCVDVTGKDWDYTSYQNGRFIEDSAKKRDKENADSAWREKVSQSKARQLLCESFLSQLDTSAMSKEDEENFVKCAIFFLRGIAK